MGCEMPARNETRPSTTVLPKENVWGLQGGRSPDRMSYSTIYDQRTGLADVGQPNRATLRQVGRRSDPAVDESSFQWELGVDCTFLPSALGKVQAGSCQLLANPGIIVQPAVQVCIGAKNRKVVCPSVEPLRDAMKAQAIREMVLNSLQKESTKLK